MAHHKVTTPLFVREHIDSLEAARTEKVLSRRKLASETGISISYIGQYERGYCFPNKENYNKLAKFFDWEKWE